MARAKKTEEVVNVGISNEDILFTLEALRASGMTDEVKEKVNSVYRTIFNEEIKHSCCKNRAFIRMDYYVRNVLKLI